MSKLLTISIPTYNRYDLLKLCLSQLMPQVEKFSNEVCLYITDNCSTDGTEGYVRSLEKQYRFVRYNRNESNLGYAGNQFNCFLHPDSKYTAILCDDDVYLTAALETLLPVLRHGEYALVALNYYSFKKNFSIPDQADYAPVENKLFTRAYDVMNYPSVGHFSGLIFRTETAKQVLQKVMLKFDSSYYEKMRGVTFDLAIRVSAGSQLPSYFIGERILACYQQDVLDYDSLKHLCIDYYNYFQSLFEEGVINEPDLMYRKNLVGKRLLRNIFSSLSSRHRKEIMELWGELKKSNLLSKGNYIPSRLLFRLAGFPPSQLIMKGVYKTYKLLKK